MGQKRVSFKVAKAIKNAGYPQSIYCPQYKENGELENGFTDLGEGYIYAPTYLDVWLWLWGEKKVAVPITCNKEERWSSYGLFSSIYEDYPCPEEAIIAAIEYLVDNNLLK